MQEFYKLVFDLAFYYTLTGCFLRLIGHVPPSAAGFIALCTVAGLDALLRARCAGAYPRLRFLPLLLPLLVLIAKPGLVPYLHMLPAWAYLAWSILTDRVALKYDAFRAHFGFTLKLLLLLIFLPLFPSERTAAALQTVPYLVLMLLTGVCMLRMLREDRARGLWQGVYMGAFLLLCAGLTLGRAPQLLLKALGLLYRNAMAPLIFFLAIGMAALFYGFYLLMSWLVARAQGKAEPPRIDLQSASEMLGLDDEYARYTADLTWLKTLLIVLAAAALLFFLFLIFRRMLGETQSRDASPAFPERREALRGTSRHSMKPGPFRPREPRSAVRYYYARFLTECVRRGLDPPAGMTAEELCRLSAPLFPGADPAALTAVYAPARYQLSRSVTQEDVRRAASAWKALRQSEAPQAENNTAK